MASSSCNCSSCKRNDCGYCISCLENNGDTCLFRKCKSVAYAFEAQVKWQQQARRLSSEYPHLKLLYQQVFAATDLLPETTTPGESIQTFKQKSLPLKTGCDDDTSMNGNSVASDSSFAAALAHFSDDLHEEEDEYRHSKPNRFQCGKCLHCQRGACHTCCFCANRDSFTKRWSNRCPFQICETVSYAISSIKDLKIKAQRAVDANPDRLGHLYERLYGENGFMTLQLNNREVEQQATLRSVCDNDESNASEKRTIMLRPRFKSKLSPFVVKVEEKEEASIHYKKVPARSLRKRSISAVDSPAISDANKTQSIKKVRQTPCRKCDGCRRPACGRCSRCSTSRSCVFRLCDNCDYATQYKAKLTGRVVYALKRTMNEHGISPLQRLADIVMAGPLFSHRDVRNGCDRFAVTKEAPPNTVSSGVLDVSTVEPLERKLHRILSSSGTKRLSACGRCEGCTITDCGLCIHCKEMGYNGRCRCVFRVCHKCDYAPATMKNVFWSIQKSLKLTRRRDGSSPLDHVAKSVMEGALASYPRKLVDMTQDDWDEDSEIAFALATKRPSACRRCTGCTITDCGLCIHCRGMGHDGRSRCVFRVCHKCDYAPATIKKLFRRIQKSLKLTRRRDGSSPLDHRAKSVVEGPLASYSRKIIDVTGRDETSPVSEVAENGTLDDRTCASCEPEGGGEVSKRAFGMPALGYSLLKGLDWKDDLYDWKDFICSLKTLSNTERETAIYFHYRQANELPDVTIRDSFETQKLERALIASVFLLAGLQESPQKTLLEKARHSILIYSLHFENDRRLMTMLTSNMNYQMDLKQILKNPKMHELEPRDFVSLLFAL